MDDGLSELTGLTKLSGLADLRGLVGRLLLAHVLLIQDLPTERMRSILDSLSGNLTSAR